MNKILAILLLTTVLSCNSYTGEFRDIKKNTFTISLPDWIEETDDLAPHALYQFKSKYRNTYGIIVKDDKNKFFEDYQKDAVNVLKNYESLTNLLVTDSTYNKNKISLELLGDLESEKIFYWHNTYESENNFYQLVLWTRSYDRKQKYGPVIEEIIASFKIKD